MAPSSGQTITHMQPPEDAKKTNYSAANAVLNTIELLEHILLQLPMKDILLNQRVSKTWKACIDHSTKLQKALFFVAVGELVLDLQGHEFSADYLEDYQFPLSLRIPSGLPPCRVLRNGRVGVHDGCGNVCNDIVEAYASKCQLLDARKFNLSNTNINPLLVEVFGMFELGWQVVIGQDQTDLDDKARRTEASWRRMLLSQPPLPNFQPSESVEQWESSMYREMKDSPVWYSNYDQYSNMSRILHAMPSVVRTRKRLRAHKIKTKIQVWHRRFREDQKGFVLRSRSCSHRLGYGKQGYWSSIVDSTVSSASEHTLNRSTA